MHWVDPLSLPESRGAVAVHLYNLHGEPDGFILDGGQQVHVPPHVTAHLERATEVGKQISVRGVKPKGTDLLNALLVAIASGKQIADDGPQDHEHPAQSETKAAHFLAKVASTLFAPKGEVCGARLEDGPHIRVHPKGNAGLVGYFGPARDIEVWDQAFKKASARVIDVKHVAFATTHGAVLEDDPA